MFAIERVPLRLVVGVGELRKDCENSVSRRGYVLGSVAALFSKTERFDAVIRPLSYTNGVKGPPHVRFDLLHCPQRGHCSSH